MSDTRPVRRRRVSPVSVLTVAVSLATGLLIAAHAAHQQAGARRSAAETAVPKPGPIPTEAATGAGAAAVGVARGPITVQYFFDGGARQPVVDSTAHHPLTIAVAHGGTIGYVARGSGWALKFPPRCTTIAKRCPRVILQGVRDDALNPGTRPVRFGASVLMKRSDTGDGANVVQKGYSVGGATQFKLQVDGYLGRPSCVIASPSNIYRIRPRVSVANGLWHNIVCARSGVTLSMIVDGAVVGSRSIPASLSIANAEPIRVGGKGTTPNNDQFAGQIDNVFVAIT